MDVNNTDVSFYSGEFFENSRDLVHNQAQSWQTSLPYDPNLDSTLSPFYFSNINELDATLQGLPTPFPTEAELPNSTLPTLSQGPFESPHLLNRNIYPFRDNASYQFIVQPSSSSQVLQDPWSQPLTRPWPNFDMNDQDVSTTSQMVPSTQLSLIEKDTSLKCTFHGCLDQQIFLTPLALKRHEDKHTRPYICSILSCNQPGFAKKADLQRHESEVHGSKIHVCPVPSCNRHKKGFGRKHNLVEHQRRRHGRQMNAPDQTSHGGLPSSPDEILGEDTDSVKAPNSENIDPQGLTREQITFGGQNVRAKLRDLQVKRQKLDGEIASLEDALRIMGEASL